MFRTFRALPTLWWISVSLLAIVTAVVVTGTLHSARSDLQRLGATTTVMVATRDLAIGTMVQAGDVQQTAWPRALLPSGTTTQAIGKTVTLPTLRGEPIVSSRLGKQGATGPSALLEDGEVAISFARDPTMPPLEVADRVVIYDGNGTASPGHVVHSTETAVTVGISRPLADRAAGAARAGTAALALEGPR